MDPLFTIETTWWLFFFTAFGLCLGSFLNVVIYRLPRGLAVNRPTWSFCPHCENPVAWHDNLPVLSYLMLRGRCRHCWHPISVRYAIVEILTALTVVILFDALLISHTRGGLLQMTSLTWGLSHDWPVFAGHIVLFACLIAMSAIDIQFYWVDIRFTHLAAACGLMLHIVWTPTHSREWTRPWDSTAFVTVATFLGFAIAWTVARILTKGTTATEFVESEQESASATPIANNRPPAYRLFHAAWLWISFLLLIVVIALAIVTKHGYWQVSIASRGFATLAFLFGVIVYEAAKKRESDVEIVDEIEYEAPQTRRNTLIELSVLLPGIALGSAAFYIITQNNTVLERVSDVIHWTPLGGYWQPLLGACTSLSGYIIAAGIGWFVRVFANLALGKEAFATGDIHLMAAAGAVAGWQVVLLGFMLTCFMAVAAWIILAPFKRTRAIPLGPWLTLGFLTATIFYNPLINSVFIRNFIDAASLLIFNNSQA